MSYDLDCVSLNGRNALVHDHRNPVSLACNRHGRIVRQTVMARYEISFRHLIQPMNAIEREIMGQLLSWGKYLSEHSTSDKEW